MKLFNTPAAVAASAFAAHPALAQPADGWNGGYGHMMGGGYGFFGGAMMLLFWGLIIFLAVLAARWLMERDGKGRGKSRDAHDILRERLARGEIDPEEFEARRKALDD